MKKRLKEIKERLELATKGSWVFDPDRDTHDSCIYVKGSENNPENKRYNYIGPQKERGGVIGSSEWTWIKNEDGNFIAHAKDDIEWLLSKIEELL